MNPNHNEQTGLSLPPPTYEAQPSAAPDKKVQEPGPNFELAKSPAQPAASDNNTALPAVPASGGVATGMPATGSNASQPTAMVATPATADDNDLIEKEWVSKAKQIVEKTKDDPSAQTKEMNKFKADYIKKRYNKDIKVADE